jgi:hypothetical protein
MNDIVDVSKIRELNDQLRHSLRGGMLVMTAGLIALGEERQGHELASEYEPSRGGSRNAELY